jgi:hypothetical protein
MAVESKPLFHPEVLRQQVRSFSLPPQTAVWQPKLQHWAGLITSGRADQIKETALLPDFLTDIFCGLLGYTGPAVATDTYTLSRERHVEVDGKFADAVLGRFQKDKEQFTAVLEGKGTRDPLERPFAGRHMSAVDQAYRYAINLPCDWIIVTSMRETRLYDKGAHQQAYECFDTLRLAADEALLKRFIFLLGAERVVPAQRECHLYELLRASETVGRTLTNQFYALYADIRQRVLTRLCRENATVAPPEILRCTQKLLDRVLFCAFCEDRGLLPAESLKRAFEHRDPYNPHPLWLNFRGLFRAIDGGNAGLNIPAYNGGLFALDPALDALQVPDEVCAHFKELGDYDYRPAREVADAAESTAVRSVIDVDILGHIFEQSITDLERLRESLERTCAVVGQCVSPASLGILATKGEAGETHCPTTAGRRRKQEGAVYPPAFITRYLVEQALGGVLKDCFETLRRQHEAEPGPHMQHARPGTLSRPDQLPAPHAPSLFRRPPRPLESKGRVLVGPVAQPTRRRPKAEFQAPDEPHEEPPPRGRVGALFAGETEGEHPPHQRLGRRPVRVERSGLSSVQSHRGRSQAAAKGGRTLKSGPSPNPRLSA